MGYRRNSVREDVSLQKILKELEFIQSLGARTKSIPDRVNGMKGLKFIQSLGARQKAFQIGKMA